MQSIQQQVIIWHTEDGWLKVIPHQTYKQAEKYWTSSWGACNNEVQQYPANSVELQALVYANIVSLAIRDKINIVTRHSEFCKISEYYNGLAIDISTEV